MPSDLKIFRRLTLGKPIIMGRRTFQSIGRALDGRDNIVVTRDVAFTATSVTVALGLDAAIQAAQSLAAARGLAEIMIIGGAEIYRQARPLADRIYLTRIHARPDGDTIFPTPEPLLWSLSEQVPIATDTRDEFGATLLVYDRV